MATGEEDSSRRGQTECGAGAGTDHSVNMGATGHMWQFKFKLVEIK